MTHLLCVTIQHLIRESVIHIFIFIQLLLFGRGWIHHDTRVDYTIPGVSLRDKVNTTRVGAWIFRDQHSKQFIDVTWLDTRIVY